MTEDGKAILDILQDLDKELSMVAFWLKKMTLLMYMDMRTRDEPESTRSRELASVFFFSEEA